MFTTYPTYFRYRTLGLTNPMMRGEDVYALQTALEECGYPCGAPDGILGPITAKRITEFQAEMRLVSDGLAGGATQRALALDIARRSAAAAVIPYAAMRGQIELESGYRLGNYSPQRPDNNYDAGVTQRNTKFTSPPDGFDAQKSIDALAANTRKHYDLFAGLNANDRRRWALAQGAWNAPAFACFIARELGAQKVTIGMTLKPTTEQRETFEAYVTNVSIYLP